jgi:hypothetical protein
VPCSFFHKNALVPDLTSKGIENFCQAKSRYLPFFFLTNTIFFVATPLFLQSAA